MDSPRPNFILAALGLVALAAAAFAADPVPSNQQLANEVNDLKATVQSQAQEIHELKAKQGEAWLNQQRATEVKALVQQVLADADTRASLMSNGMTAGHNGTNFFLASEDNSFLLLINGQFQVRYDYDLRHTDPASSTNGDESGFNIHRAKLAFEGYIGNPRIEYKFQFEADRNTTTVQLEDAYVSYEFVDDAHVWTGRFHDRFARESLMSSRNQQTASRSTVDYVWAANDDYVDGLGVDYTLIPDYLIYAIDWNEGLNSGSVGSSGTGEQTGFQNTGGHDFYNSSTEFAVTSRLDLKLMGQWSEQDDVESWSTTNGPQLFLGAAVHYELAKSGEEQSSGRFIITPPGGAATSYPYNSFIQWTGDTLFKDGPFSLMATGFGWYFYDVTGGTAAGANQKPSSYAATLQAGYFVIPDKLEPFARYEWIGVDDLYRSNDLSIVTGGFNWFFRRHTLKLTTDVNWALNNVNSANTFGTSLTGVGLLTDDPKQRNQLLIRSQIQVLF